MMDEKTAIYCMMVDIDEKRCENCPECGKMTDGEHCANRAVKMAIKALEKQVSLKIKEEKWTDTKCRCGHVFSKHLGDGYHDIPYQNKTAYCPECGQKLDWTGGTPNDDWKRTSHADA